MTCEELRQRLSYYFDNELQESDLEAVQNHLSECRTCPREYQFLSKIVSMVQASLTEPKPTSNLEKHLIESVTLQKKSMQSRLKLRYALFSVAAIIVIFISLFLILNQPSPKLLEGEARIENNRIYTSDKYAKIELVDKTLVELKKESELKIHSRREVEFLKGEVVMDVAKDGLFQVKSEQATVKVLGTKFELKKDGKNLIVRVFSGRIHVENDHGSEILNANDTVICQEGKKPEKDKLVELKALIKKLGDNDTALRNESQENILKLMQGEAKAKKDIKHLVTEIKSEVYCNKDTEVKSRLTSIMDRLTKGKWVAIKDSPIEGRSKYTSVVSDGKLIIWGGSTREKTFNDGAVYNIQNDCWTKVKDSPLKPREGHTAVVSGSKMIIWGGYGNGNYYNDGAIYNIEGDSWTLVKECPLDARCDHICVVVGDKMLIWGGWNKKKCFNDGVVYNLKNENWKIIGKSPLEGRRLHKAIVLDDKIFFLCGWNFKNFLSDGAIYNLKSDSWLKIKDIPLSGADAVMEQVGDKIFAWGGWDEIQDYNDGAVYDPKINKWDKIETKSPLKISKDRKSVNLEEKVIIWGGYHGFECCSDGAIYDIQRKKWFKIEQSFLEGRYEHALAVFENMLIVWGGVDASNKFYNDGAIYELPIICD